MVTEIFFTVPIISLPYSDQGIMDVKIGTIGRSKWFLTFHYRKHIRNGCGIGEGCIYRSFGDELLKFKFDVSLYYNNVGIMRKTMMDDMRLASFSYESYCATSGELRGSISVIESSESDSSSESDDELLCESDSSSDPLSTVPIPFCSSTQLMDDYLRMLNDPDSFHDAVLKCGHNSVPVHKCVLSARSPVFAAMFQNRDMQEGRDGVVNIVDIKMDALRAMLEYVYSGKCDLSMAEDLLEAADKYQLDGLKSMSVEKLKSNMTASNVLRTLVLGDLHDRGLKAHAMEFICNHNKFSKLKNSEEWKLLHSERPALAIEVLTSIVVYIQNK